MKPQTLTKTLLTALALTSMGQASPALRSQIATKEKQLASLQAEISSLKSQLTTHIADENIYVVKPGDTLSSIARRHSLSPATLIKMNQLSDPSKLMVGQKITVKTKKAQTAQKATSQTSYIVKKGDTFYSIARRNGISVSKLQTFNPNVTASRIARGQKLIINKAAANIASEDTQLISTSRKKSTPKPPPVKTKKLDKPVKNVDKKSKTKAKAKPKPAPIPTPVVKKETPKPEPKPEIEPVVEEQIPSPLGVTSIILTEETTFDAFAIKHGTTTTKLNELNGWNLPKSTTLARGSEIYLPK